VYVPNGIEFLTTLITLEKPETTYGALNPFMKGFPGVINGLYMNDINYYFSASCCRREQKRYISR
jgi:hypothetical protein